MSFRNPQMDIKDKTVIVTGGASGIGESISKLIASEGGKVSICDIETKRGEELVKSLNDKYNSEIAVFYKCDVTDINVFRECFKKTKQKFGSIHVVVNNAGIWNDSPTGWSREVDINYKGVVNGCSLAFEFMGKRGEGNGGTVINMASMLGLTTTSVMPIYSGTKAAVIALTRCFGSEIYNHMCGLRFMVICPNATETHLFEDVKEHFLFKNEEILKEFEALNIISPPQTPDGVAKCVLKAFRFGENGSVWVSEMDKEGFKVRIEDLPLDGKERNSRTLEINKEIIPE